jgi:hypothetical protein
MLTLLASPYKPVKQNDHKDDEQDVDKFPANMTNETQ